MLKRASFLTLLVGSAWLIQAALVQAHADPVRFEPPPGAVLANPPAKVEGWFTSELRRDPNWSNILVTDPQGTPAQVGEPVLSSDRRQMSVSLKTGLPHGEYLVTWRSWSDADSEIVENCFTFYVGADAAAAAINARTPMGGGGKCQGFEISAKNGTPTPKQIADVKAERSEDHSDGGPAPLLAGGLALIAGVLAGMAGGIFVGRRSG